MRATPNGTRILSADHFYSKHGEFKYLELLWLLQRQCNVLVIPVPFYSQVDFILADRIAEVCTVQEEGISNVHL